MTDPVFAKLEHPSFPAWLREGLDALFAATDRIEKVSFSLWGVVGYKERYVDLTGTADFHFGGGNAVDRQMDPDEMDCIPQVRRFERRAGELWNYLPITFTTDEGFSLNGDYDIYATRDGHLHFSYQMMTGDEHDIVIEARWKEGAWETNDQIILNHYEGTHSDLLAGDAEGAFSSFDPSDLELKSHPVPNRVSINEDGVGVVFHFPAGEITRCMKSR